MPEVKKEGGEYVWIDCSPPTKESQDREVVIASGTEPLPTGEEVEPGMTGARRMCIKFEMRQKQNREVEVVVCEKYKAEPKLTTKKAVGVGFIALGVLIAFSGGTALLVAGALVAAGGLYVTLDESATLNPNGFRPGQHLGTERNESPGPWTDSGPPQKILIPPPFPC